MAEGGRGGRPSNLHVSTPPHREFGRRWDSGVRAPSGWSCRHLWHLAPELAAHDCDLDLSSMDLSNITDWRNVDFAGINLSNANFKGCKLSGANFHGAKLSGANFSNANIIGLTQIDGAQLNCIAIDRSALPPAPLQCLVQNDTPETSLSGSGSGPDSRARVSGSGSGFEIQILGLGLGPDFSGSGIGLGPGFFKLEEIVEETFL